METSKNLTQLAAEIRLNNLNLDKPTGKNGRYLKEDYLRVLRNFNLFKKYETYENIPMNLRFRLTYDSPQLAYNYFDLKKEDQDSIWENENVWLLEKIRGVRATLIYNSNEGISCFGRDYSDKEYLPLDYTSRIISSNLEANLLKEIDFAFAIDVEITLNNRKVIDILKGVGNYDLSTDYGIISILLTMKKTEFDAVVSNIGIDPLFKYKILDVYFWKGKDYRKNTYKEREFLFDEAVLEMFKQGIVIDRPLICKENVQKKAFHEGLLKDGAEGSIAVFVDKPCLLDGNRKKDYWLKIKKSLFAALFDPSILTDSVDGWIATMNKTRIGNVEMAFDNIVIEAFNQQGETIVIAVTDAVPLSLRLKIKEGDVVEVSGFKWTDGMIEEAVIENIRFDKQVSNCVISV